MATELSACRVLVTPTSYAKHDSRLRTELETAVGEVVYSPVPRPLTSAEVRELLVGVDGFIAGLDVIDRDALAGADQLKVIARYGVGVEKVDLAAAREKGVVVTNTPGANSSSVAELALGLMLSLARQIPSAAQATREGGWPRLSGLSLEGKTVGLLGFGSIGREVAKRLQGWNCRVVAYDPYADTAMAKALGVTLATQSEVVCQADMLSLHMPVTVETRGLVNAGLLAQMKRGSLLINTARGELIDEGALLAALESGQIAGAGLDCFSVEPPGAENPLLMHPHVIATPHAGAHTDGAINAMGWAALRNCLAVLKGEVPPNPVAV
ncbi:MAG: phosphoglycerate dehydrogenase [Anaerolineae bacterium]